MSVLVCGGAGYIGSHTVHQLIKNGEDVIIVDNIILDTSKNYNSIEEELSAIETQYVPEVNHFSLGNKEDNINMRRIYDIKENIGEDILNKLSYKEQEYFVI